MTQLPNFEWELKNPGDFIGIDEAGCGPWAGPVVAAAVHIPSLNQTVDLLTGINDSKKLTAIKRTELFNRIISLNQTGHIYYGVGQASVEEIDSLNIGQATRLAMIRAFEQLITNIPFALSHPIVYVDGIRIPNLPVQTIPLIKGDQKSISIAAASIVAKVTRDKLMQDLHQTFPNYGWNSNAGYGTASHQKALATFGITPHHRRSYAPIKKLLGTV